MIHPNLLVATDLLPKSQSAVVRAAILARNHGANVTLLHAVPNETSSEQANVLARAAARALRQIARDAIWTGVPTPNTVVSVGSPPRVIAETADALHADLIVIGPHAPRGARETITEGFTGTVAAKLLAGRICPVLIAREPARQAYSRVLMALDLSATSGAVIRAAESLVLVPHADASVLHAFDEPYQGLGDHGNISGATSSRYKSLWSSHATVSVRTLLRRASCDFARYGIQIDDNTPTRAILDAMKHQEPDLLVMGTRGRGPLRRALLGSIANEVLSEAWCDVFVVPEGSFERVAAGLPATIAFRRPDGEGHSRSPVQWRPPG